MQCGTPLSFFKPVLLVAGLAGVGMGGYNLATTGCPLGTCSSAPDSAMIIPAATSTSGDEPASGCCASKAAELVEANASAECPQSACTESDPEGVTLVSGSETVKGCCESMPSKATAIEASLLVADECDAASCDPGDCETSELVADDAEADAEG